MTENPDFVARFRLYSNRICMKEIDYRRALIAGTLERLREARVPLAIIAAGLAPERAWVDFLLEKWAEQNYQELP